jgi:hypothetical protein
MPAMKTYREAIFSGWFGPMGVGAVFLSMIAKEEMLEIYQDDAVKPVTINLISPVVLFIVLSSTLVHGTTIPLFKIGKRIRTRTLSIASTGSGQVLRLPKLQFGQQISLRKSEDDRSHVQGDNSEAMSQLKRNTLANTIQHVEPSYAIDMHDGVDEDGLKEEDFLPDESDETEVGYDDVAVKQPTSFHMVATEPQSIRFLEPVNPRSGSASQNLERNEASVSSLRSWMHRNHKAQDNADITGTEEAAIVSSPPTTTTTGSGSGLRNLFRRYNAKETVEGQHQQQMPTVQVTSPKESEQEHHSHLSFVHGEHHEPAEEIIDLGTDKLNPRIEVWDEPNHVVIEDKEDASSHSVIDKVDANWEEAVKQRISELQGNIQNEVPPKHETP